VILAADVGGTKTHVALYDPGANPRSPAVDRKVASRDFPSLERLVTSFLEGVGWRSDDRLERVALGIAGPVVDNRADTTNLPWEDVSGAAMSDSLDGAQVALLNDLEATAWGLATLAAGDLHTLQAGTPAAGNRALIAAGTGLGEALLVWDRGRWHPTASEGGHVDLAPRDPLEDELLAWLRERYGRVSYERVVSGRGIADVYRFLADTGRGEASPEVAARFAAAEDPPAVVTEAAMAGRCGRCALALRRFVMLYGAEAGNLALKALATGGVYVGGGIAPRILALLDDGVFMEAFVTKGRLSPVMERLPVHVIMRPETGLWGAAAYAFSQASNQEVS
jgi:glucokinase